MFIYLATYLYLQWIPEQIGFDLPGESESRQSDCCCFGLWKPAEMTSTGYYGGVEGYISNFLSNQFNQCFQWNWVRTIKNLQGVKVSTFLTFTSLLYKQLVNLYRSVGQRYTLSQHVYAVFSLQLFDIHKYLTIQTISNLWTASRPFIFSC